MYFFISADKHLSHSVPIVNSSMKIKDRSWKKDKMVK